MLRDLRETIENIVDESDKLNILKSEIVILKAENKNKINELNATIKEIKVKKPSGPTNEPMKHNSSELNKEMQVIKALMDQPNSKIACLEMEIKEVKNKVDTKLDNINKNIEINNKFNCKFFL